MHHSIVELPDANYKPRAYDPRSGYGGMSYENFSAPLGTADDASASSAVIVSRRRIRRRR